MTRRILVVAPFAPALDGRHGGARAVHGLVRELARRHQVVLLHLDDGPIDPAVAASCAEVHTVTAPDPGPWGVRARGAAAAVRARSLKAAASAVPQLRRRVGELSAEFLPDVVQVEFGVLGDALAGAYGPLRVLTVHDPAASLREELALRRDGLPLVHRLDAHVALREERRVVTAADAAVVFTERDRRLVERSAPGATVHTIALGWDVPERPLDPAGADPPSLLFVGNFAHPPNVDAARTLACGVFPQVRAARPDVRLDLVGASPPGALVALAGRGVAVVGEVPDVTPYLDRAAVVVAPLAMGGGMRVKVLEALAAGKAVVASSRAAEGIAAVPGQELVVVDGLSATAAAIVRLLDDAGARRRLGAGARAWAQRELSWAAMADRYEHLYEQIEHRR